MTSKSPSPGRRAHVSRLTLHTARTYGRLTLELDAGTTVLVGPNGIGKTNLLECLAVALTGASPRTSSELRLIQEGAPACRIAVQVTLDSNVHERDVLVEAGKGKQLRVDGSVVRSVEAYGSAVPVVTFLPERLLIIRGAPQRRRALVDHLAGQVLAASSNTQQQYSRALQQRNAVLRRAKIGHDVAEQLAPWSAQLLEHGERYREQRCELLELLAAPYADRFEQITGLAGGAFAASLRGGSDLAVAFAEVASAEQRRGTTLAGPHLDDLVPMAAERDLRAFGSAGEQRAALLAFTLAARDLIEQATGVEPIVLLDEPWSELDQDRRRRLTQLLAPLTQVVITSTEPPSHLAQVIPGARVLQVSSGAVAPWTSPDHTTR